MGRAGGRAGEGVSPLHAANGFTGLQQNGIPPHSAALIKQATFGNTLPSRATLHQLNFDASGMTIPSMNDISSLLPPLTGANCVNGVNHLLMQYHKAQQEQHNGLASAHTSAFHRHEAAGPTAAHIQAQLLGVANGQFVEQISQMMSTNHVMLGANNHMRASNFDGNGQPAATRLPHSAHPLPVPFDLSNQQQKILASPISCPIPGFTAESLVSTNCKVSSHKSGIHTLQGPAQHHGSRNFGYVGSSDVGVRGLQATDAAGESSGVESAEENPTGKGDRKEARKEYHKKIERKRRDRMRNLYDELRSLVNPDEPADKNSVLAGAVSLIQVSEHP